MDNKISYLFAGAVSIFVVFLVVILIITRADVVPQAVTQEKTIDQTAFDQAKSKVSNLQNFGNLPLTITNDEVGKANPFVKE